MHLKPMGIPGKCPAHLRAWTPEEDAVLIELYPSMRSIDIAVRVNRGVRSTQQRIFCLQQAGLMPRKNHPFTPEQDAFIRRNRHTLSALQIATHLGKNPHNIVIRARYLGVSLCKYGDFYHRTKYPDEDVSLIRQLRDEYGMTFREIGKKFEISPHVIRDIYHKRQTACDAIAREYLPR